MGAKERARRLLWENEGGVETKFGGDRRVVAVLSSFAS